MIRPSPAPVVVGVDGSASSLAGVRAAALQAAAHGCPLHIVHAFNWLPRQSAAAAADPRHTAEGVLGQALATARGTAPDLEVTARVLEGSATVALLHEARTAALTVVGDGGLSRHVCLPVDSVAVQVAARAASSVLVARAAPLTHGPIVVGVNDSPAAELALDFAFDAAARRRAEVVAVHGWTARPGASDDDRASQLADLVAPREEKYAVPVRLRMLPGEPGDVLLRQAEGAALVVLGTRGRRPYGGLLGSVAQTLLHHCHAPLVLVRNLMPVPSSGTLR